MVRIALTNQNSNSPYKTAIVDLSERTCLLNHEDKINLYYFKKLDFSHPLLSETSDHSPTNSYCYHFDNFADLWLAPRQVYGTLIHNNDSTDSEFEILPSPSFYKLKTSYQIPFSLDYHKEANEKISVNQLNNIVSNFSAFQFQFQDKLIIKSRFHYRDLPAEVDGDSLYSKDDKIMKLLEQADNFEALELRYINHFIGFGVFARQEISKGACVSFYYGMKKIRPQNLNYYFYPKLDSFNMGIDARECGNIARFINHAPNAEDIPTSTFMAANLISTSYTIFGIEVMAFFALRDIKKGEQLLFNYSKKYFDKMELFKFKLDGNLVNFNDEKLADNREQRITTLRVFARNGIKQALFKLIKHYSLVILAILIFGLVLNYLTFNTN
ncbi:MULTISPECIES: SET domain-containing protein-lysine N-methyltransferase [Legionella]|uniref:SET domain protein n=1 Tax=Legionella drozanskii LLAP-1 TaxID=1212489 RepID=A0A0W0SMR4_9GAMM|nr:MULTISPECIES: SET domain-containing protein-lysine N-methyltransferase [Legionella]KTC84656.1 SET domain protein [Legionella drozanskii LLAP-1]